MGLAIKDNHSHNYGEYLTWPDNPRYEIIDGFAYAMSPAPARVHQRLVGELYRQIADALEDSHCEVNIAPFDVRLPASDTQQDDEITDIVQPDIVIVCDPDKLDEQGCRGAPDWVIEVLSPRTASHDQIHKLALYEKHGVQEYWLAHPTDRIITIYRLEDDNYGKPAIYEMRGTLPASCCDSVEILWDKIIEQIE